MKNDESIKHWKAAKELFENYLDVPTPQAIQEINDNPDITKEIKGILLELIEAQTGEDTVIDEPDLSFFTTVQKQSEDLSGQTLAGYYLIERIGQGGMSGVYKAERKNSEIQKYVAFKILTPAEEELSETLKILFEREQLTLSKLSHPNIISFHHGGISEKGRPYLIMDYIENAMPIDDYIRKNNLPIKETVSLTAKIANALSYAHQNMIVHKDIKPNNVLIDALGIPKVVDFGIASFGNQEKNKDSTSSVRIFTPDYASPEQINNETVSAASDIFSLAAMLLALISGKKPLPQVDKGFNNNDLTELYSKHILQLLAEPSIDKDLSCILLMALQFDSGKRYKSMQAFEEDLSSWLKKKPVKARKQTRLYLLKKYITRNPALSATLSALLVSVCIGFYATIHQKNQAQLQALKARQVTDFLIDSIQSNDPDISKGREITVNELLQNAKLKIQETRFQDIQLTTNLQLAIGSALTKTGQYKEAEKLLTDAISTDPNNSSARISLADLYLNQQYFNQCENQLKYLESDKSHLSDTQVIQVARINAGLLFKQGNFIKAITMLDSVLRLPEIEPRQWIESKLMQADIYDEDGQHDKSIQILKEALNKSDSLFSRNSTTSTDILSKMADVYANMSPVPEKQLQDIYSETLDVQSKIYGNNHPVLAKTYLRYGFLLKTLGKNEEARNYANKARSIALTRFGENHMLTAHIDLLISQLNYIKGDIDSAIRLLNHTLEVYQTHYGNDHFETNQIKTTLAGYYLKSGKGKLALDMLEPVYEFQKQQYGAANKATIYARLMMLKAYNLARDYQKSVIEAEKLLDISISALGEEHIVTIGVKFSLAESYIYNKQPENAKRLCNDLLQIELVKNNSRYLQKTNELMSLASNEE